MRYLYPEHNGGDHVVKALSIKCNNFHINPGLKLKDKTVEEIITQFVLNSVLHHVVLSCIISSNNKTKYKTEDKNPDWLNKYLWYNTAICSKLHGIVFEHFIRNNRTDRQNLMGYITTRNSQKPTYVDDASSGANR